MPYNFKNFIKDKFFSNAISSYINNIAINSYAQYQEDLIIDSYFKGKSGGCYIDIGAHDPEEISNTKKFYLKDWSGINIDPNKNAIEQFNIHRPNDINLNIGISMFEEDLTFYEMYPRYISTFSRTEANRNLNISGVSIINTYKVACLPLKKIFEIYKFVPDFISIDVEDYEETVLNSNDWNKYRPELIVIEIRRNAVALNKYMEDINYIKIFNNHTNAIFKNDLLL